MRVDIENLRIAFPAAGGWQEAVRGVSLTLGREKLGLVGESGSGKSLTARSILRLMPRGARVTADRLLFDGVDVLSASENDLRRLRGRRAGLILQDPRFSLNPTMTAGSQVAEAWRAHRGGSRRDAWRAAVDLLDQVRLRDPERVARLYPHELSGGMGSRVMIAIMLAPGPELLIADEPTSALDATVQAEILRLLDELVEARGMALLLISHDLPLIGHFCDRVAVMYAGRIVEECSAAELTRARHPYTRGLLDCVPALGQPRPRLPTLRRDPAWLDA